MQLFHNSPMKGTKSFKGVGVLVRKSIGLNIHLEVKIENRCILFKMENENSKITCVNIYAPANISTDKKEISTKKFKKF